MSTDLATREFNERLEAHDSSLLELIPAQLSQADRESLLALHDAWRTVYGPFTYLEIGSHLGGSLQALVRDPLCTGIVSIDSRPPDQPDMRGFRWQYPDNSTARMIAELERVPDADLSKLHTIDATTDRLDPATVEPRPRAIFIDAEHTDVAVRKDAAFCRRALAEPGCIVFHDAQLVYRGIRGFLDDLASEGAEFRGYYLPKAVFVVEIGPSLLRSSQAFVDRVLENGGGYLWSLNENDPYREWYLRSVRRRVRNLRDRVSLRRT